MNIKPSILSIRLHRLRDLFEVAPRDPWKDGPEVPESGIDQALRRMRGKPGRHFRSIVFELDELTAADSERLARAPDAWKNHCLVVQAQCRMEATRLHKTGVRVLDAALLVTMLALGLAAFFEHAQPLPKYVNELFSQGFIIIGWVILWRPIDTLVFDASIPRLLARSYGRLADMPIEIVSHDSA